MGVINTVGFPKNLDKSIDKMFYDQYVRYQSEHDKVAKFQSPYPGKSIKEAETSGVGHLVEKPEGSAIQYKVPTEGNEQTYYYKAYALGVYITKEMLDDELHNIMRKIGVEGLARSAAQMKELKFFEMLNAPTTAATNTCKDGAAILATGRTLLNSTSTLSNTPATAADLSETSLQAAFDYFEHNVVDENGFPISMKPSKLLVASGNSWVAKRLHQQEYGVNSTNRDDMTTNPNNNYVGGWNVFVSRYLTDADAWFLISDDADLRFVWKDKPMSEKDYDFDLKAWKWSVYMRFATFCYDYKGIYGSVGNT